MATPISPKIEDHTDQAIARSPGFTLGSSGLNKIIAALTVGTQAIEDTLDDFLNLQAIGTAEGVQLDNLGTILDLARITGQSDASYSAALLGRAAAISAQSGTTEQLIQTYQLLVDATSIFSTDLQPATFELTAVAVDDLDPPDVDVIAAMDQAKAAGVLLLLQICVDPCFLWGAEADADANGDLPAASTGFGAEADADANGDILPGVGGGNLARVL